MGKYITAKLNRYEAYTEYKDSGVSYIGEIPSHWTIQIVNMQDLSQVNKVIVMFMNTFVFTRGSEPLYTVVPPIEEQEEILSYLGKFMDQFNGIMINVNSKLVREKVTEYARYLIKEVVTGKVKVN